MSNHQRVKVPGKLLIAGEYAILEAGNASIVVAVDRYVTVDIQEDQLCHLTIETWPIDHLRWSWQEDSLRWQNVDASDTLRKLAYVKNAIEVAYDYLNLDQGSRKTYGLHISSDLEDQVSGRKYGLGSSGAVVVGVIAALMAFYSQGLPPIQEEELFKLAYIAHLRTQGNGSGVDIAASVYGGCLSYHVVDRQWIRQEIDRRQAIKTLVKKPWPGLAMAPITLPESLHMMVGWSGKPAATGPMVDKYLWLSSKDTEAHMGRLQTMRHIMASLLHGFESDNIDLIKASIRKHRHWLQMIDQQGNIGIESPELKVMCDIADTIGVGKTSGAGGGDCGIAFVTSLVEREKLIQAWYKAGIQSVDLKISQGVSVVE